MNSTSPIINSSVTTLPLFINTTNMTGPAAAAGVIFADSTVFSGTLIGNATFNDTSHNEGTITGNATLNTTYYSGTTQTGATFTIASGATWEGEVQGTVYSSDDTPVTTLNFTGTGSNEGTINTNATFNGTTFRMGEVNGTATLGGTAQVIRGVNTVINFVKQLVTGRDTLYFTSGSSLNVSGLFTLLGKDANNLLSIRSTMPGTVAQFIVNGTTNFNFLRLKDINNTGTSVNLSSKTAFDDGGNTGFTFPANTTSSSRGGITRSYTAPTLPPSRGGSTPGGNTGGETSNRNSSTNAYLRNLIRNTLKPLQFSPLTPFNPFGQNFDPNTIGATVIPYPFKDFKAPGQITLINLPFNFLTNISRFLFAPIPQTIADLLTSKPQLGAFIASVGFSKEQELAALTQAPVKIPSLTEQELPPPGLFIITSGTQTLTTYATYDKSAGGLAQLVYTSPDQSLTLSLIPQSTGDVLATYLGQTLLFTQGSLTASTQIQTPTTGGRYILKTSSSPIPLLIEVIEPVKIEEQKKENIFMRAWKWLIN
jgi:hypothetical protein